MTYDPTLPFVLPVRPTVTCIRQRALTDLVKGPPARTQPLSGYDAHYGDIVDYIVRITEEIWRDRVVDRIYETYDADCNVYGASYVMTSAQEVVTATLETLEAYPDGVTDHVNIAWRGDENDGFYTSHLGYSGGTNLGASEFGPARGKRVMSYFVADCISKNNLIHTEWLICDSSAVLCHLGLDLHETAQKKAMTQHANGFVVSPPIPLDAPEQRSFYAGPNDTPDGWVLHHIDTVWNAREFDHIPFHYSPDAIAHWPGCREAVGPDAIKALIEGLLVSVPDVVTCVEHVSWSEETDGVILAARWLLSGSTQSGGIFGDVPHAKKIAFWGSSHFRFGNGHVVEEWTVFDELDALIQAYRS